MNEEKIAFNICAEIGLKKESKYEWFTKTIITAFTSCFTYYILSILSEIIEWQNSFIELIKIGITALITVIIILIFSDVLYEKKKEMGYSEKTKCIQMWQNFSQINEIKLKYGDNSPNFDTDSVYTAEFQKSKKNVSKTILDFERKNDFN